MCVRLGGLNAMAMKCSVVPQNRFKSKRFMWQAMQLIVFLT
jgi:hypothetical protein